MTLNVRITKVPDHLKHVKNVRVGQEGKVMGYRRDCGLLKYVVKLKGKSFGVMLPASHVEQI